MSKKPRDAEILETPTGPKLNRKGSSKDSDKHCHHKLKSSCKPSRQQKRQTTNREAGGAKSTSETICCTPPSHTRTHTHVHARTHTHTHTHTDTHTHARVILMLRQIASRPRPSPTPATSSETRRMTPSKLNARTESHKWDKNTQHWIPTRESGIAQPGRRAGHIGETTGLTRGSHSCSTMAV